MNEKRPKLKVGIHDFKIESLVDIGADITITSQESWHANWPLQGINVHLLGIGTLSQVKQSARWNKWKGPEGQRGISKPYVANNVMDLRQYDLLQQWKTQIKIPPILETKIKFGYGSGKCVRTHYYEQSWVIQVEKEQDTKAASLPKTLTALLLQLLTDEPVQVVQWPLTTEKLQTLEELVQEQLCAQ